MAKKKSKPADWQEPVSVAVPSWMQPTIDEQRKRMGLPKTVTDGMIYARRLWVDNEAPREVRHNRNAKEIAVARLVEDVKWS